jgi:hypothetical protein
MKRIAIPSLALALLAAPACGTRIQNPVEPAPVVVSMALGGNQNSSVSNVNVCVVNLRFQSAWGGATVSVPAVNASLPVSYSDTAINQVTLSQGTYQSIEADLGPFCTAPTSLAWSSQGASYTSQDFMTLRFPTSFTVSASTQKVTLQIQAFIDQLVPLMAGGQAKSALEAVSGAVDVSYGSSRIQITGSNIQGTSVCRKYLVQNLDATGALAAAAQSYNVSMTGAQAGAFYYDPACTAVASLLTIGAGASAVEFYLKDPTAESLVLHATASGGPQIPTDTHAVDVVAGSAAWSQRSPIASPPGINLQKGAYHLTRNSIIYYGGDTAGDGTAVNADMWEYRNANWTRLCTNCAPGPRASHGLVYDSKRDRLVLFGGGANSPGSAGNSTWEWDGTNWNNVSSQVAGTPPQARSFFFSAYDSVRRRMVLFGGQDNLGTVHDDVYEYDGSSWYGPFTPGTRPSARQDAGANGAFDPIHGRFLVYGGAGTGSDDLWAWNGASWSQLCSACTGTPRRSAYVSFDESRNKLVIAEGYGSAPSGEVAGSWEIDGTSISASGPIAGPTPARDSGMMVYNALTGKMLFFGGNTCGLGCTFHDTWEYGGP